MITADRLLELLEEVVKTGSDIPAPTIALHWVRNADKWIVYIGFKTYEGKTLIEALMKALDVKA